MISTPPIMLKAPYSNLFFLFGPLKRAQIIYNIFISYKKTKRKNSSCVDLCPAPLVRFMWSLVGYWIFCWNDSLPCALSFSSLVIFVATWIVSPSFQGPNGRWVGSSSVKQPSMLNPLLQMAQSLEFDLLPEDKSVLVVVPTSNLIEELFELQSYATLGGKTLGEELKRTNWWLFTASAPRLSEVIIVPKNGYRSYKEQWIIEYNIR